MTDTRDPAALLRHAIQAGDWPLVALIARALNQQRGEPSQTGRRAYRSLCLRLGLTERRD
jgi:hypothetical protein